MRIDGLILARRDDTTHGVSDGRRVGEEAETPGARIRVEYRLSNRAGCRSESESD